MWHRKLSVISLRARPRQRESTAYGLHWRPDVRRRTSMAELDVRAKHRFSRFVLLIAFTILAVTSQLAMSQAPPATNHLPEPIRVTGGLVTGTPTIQWVPGVRLFRGIPYAAPPVGDLRWRPPQPVVPWKGVKAADHFSPACMQPPTETTGSSAWHEGLVPISEDCLYVDVWTSAKSTNDRLPVMVYIYGGGNI